MIKIQMVLIILWIININLPNYVVSQSDKPPVYKNKVVTIEDRIENLLNQMTLAEKIAQLSGVDFMHTRVNERLGIPALHMTDGPLGPNGFGRATNFSSAINMASSWDVELIDRVGQAIAKETVGYGFNLLLAPLINIARVPQWGRIYESFGEDPFLTSQMTVTYINALQSNGVIACVKTLACNNQEFNRRDVNANISERALHEIYFPACKAAVEKADVGAVMTAYNMVNGDYCCESKFLIKDILKDQWGFNGFIMSDWGSVHNTKKATNAGLDLEMPSGQHFGDSLMTFVQTGQIPSEIIDEKVRRILRVMFKFGLFDDRVKSKNDTLDPTKHRALALEMAQNSMVLLKNEKNFLPLDKNKIHSIAVVGPNSDVARTYGCGSGWLDSFYKISPLEGLQNKVGNNVQIYFVRGSRQKRTELPVLNSTLLIPPENVNIFHGLKGEYFNNPDLQGEPVLTRVDQQIDFNWGTGSPVPGIVNAEKFSIRWTGKVVAPESGTFEIGFNADNGFRLFMDEQLLIDSWKTDDQSPGVLKTVLVGMEATRQYEIKIEFYENVGTSRAKLGMTRYDHRPAIAQAVKSAIKSDVAVVCVGLNDQLEGEDLDREYLQLPADQIELINNVSQVNKNCIVVLFNAGPVTMQEWINNVPVVIEAFYPGQEGGNALADILFGDINPSGKLPMTFMKRWEDSPSFANYPGTKESVDYSEGIYVGYRYFDTNNVEPLFPFGHGLSYTQFQYRQLKIIPQVIDKNDTIYISATVENIGNRAGDEIVQLYIRDVKSSIDRPFKELKGFKKIHLKAAQSTVVGFELNISAFSFFHPTLKSWIVEPGIFEVMIGSSSKDIRLRDRFNLN